jgi:hypothetical protein
VGTVAGGDPGVLPAADRGSLPRIGAIAGAPRPPARPAGRDPHGQ